MSAIKRRQEKTFPVVGFPSRSTFVERTSRPAVSIVSAEDHTGRLCAYRPLR
jgi:hypothetical protein